MDAKLTTTLLPHQKICVDHILDIHHAERTRVQSGVVVSMLWGSGKTLTSLEAALVIRNQRRPSERVPILVFTDVSTVEDWNKNASDHYSPALTSTILSSKARVDTTASLMNWHTIRRQDIIVTNVEIMVGFYSIVHARRIKLIEKALNSDISAERKAALRYFAETGAKYLRHTIPDEELAKQELCTPTTDACHAMFYAHWPIVIIDEAHKVRNADSMWFFVMSQLRDRFRISLTATPFNNNIHDVVSVLSITNITPPSRLATRMHTSIIEEWTDLMRMPEEFCADFTKARDRYVIYGGMGAAIDRQRYCPVDVILRVPFDTEAERRHYDTLIKHSGQNALKSAVRLKQTCSGIYKRAAAADDWPDMTDIVPTKIRAVLEYLSTVVVARGEKANILCEYRTSLEQLRKYICDRFKMSVGVYTVHGETSAKARQIIRCAYERHRGAAVLIVTSVFNQGVNLHCANHTILFSTQWNPVVSDQGRSRCERPAQTRSVFSVQIVIEDTIEDLIWSVATLKRQTNREVMFGTVTSELLTRVAAHDEEQTPIEEQLKRVVLTKPIEFTMREQCTHYISSIASIATSVPKTTLISALRAGGGPVLKRLTGVGVVVEGRVVERRL